MAQGHKVSTADRRSMLIGFAESYGLYPPRSPAPAWWWEFEKFYKEVKQEADDRPLYLRTEGFKYDEDYDDEDYE